MLLSLPLKIAAATLHCKKVSTAYAKAMDSGYPLEWFVDPVEDSHICEICGKVLRFPRSTPCGHVFCLHCLEFWIEYYGICPKRCGEIELETTSSVGSLEKRIQSLQTRCKYHKRGCKAIVALEEKEKHEKRCIRRERKVTVHFPVEGVALSQDSYVEMASRGRADGLVPAESTCGLVEATSHTFHLTRKAEESLGFVLVAGAKNSNGKAVNFSIKTVDPGSVSWKAGLQPGDRIIKLDNIALSSLSQQEAVHRIKYNHSVLLTILRESGARDLSPTLQDHLYEEILYSGDKDSAPRQEDDDTSPNEHPGMMGNSESHGARSRRRHRHMLGETRGRVNTAPDLEQLKVPEVRHRSTTTGHEHGGRSKLLVEKVSADSGLSSGSSGPPNNLSKRPHHQRHPLPAVVATKTEFSKEVQTRHSYHNARELRKRFLKSGKALGESIPSIPQRNTYIEDGYEVEEIFMEKNGTNQLGITLGYDAKLSSTGNLFVCEVVANGLAAKDGRLQRGDIVRKVNGFEVYDPEEAVLLFLEQDQDITLTVARKIETSAAAAAPPPLSLSHHRAENVRLKGSKSQASLLTSVTRTDTDTQLRRTDSCGSLDSHTFKPQDEVSHQPTNAITCTQAQRQPQATRSHSPSKLHVNHRRQHSDTSRVTVQPRHRARVTPSVSSGYSTGENPSIITTTDQDSVFVPATSHTTSNKQIQSGSRNLKTTQSIGSDPAGTTSSSRHHFQHRQRSVGCLTDWGQSRSPPALLQSSPNYHRSVSQDHRPIHTRCNMVARPGEMVHHHIGMTHAVKNESLV